MITGYLPLSLIACLQSKAGLEPHLRRLCGGGSEQWDQNEAGTAASYCQSALPIHCTVQGGAHRGPGWNQKTTRAGFRGQREPQRRSEYESGQTDRKGLCVSQPWRSHKNQCKRRKKLGVHIFKMLFFMMSTCFALMSMLPYNLLQESVGHWSQGLKSSMQDPKMQVVKNYRFIVGVILIWIPACFYC